MIRRALAVFLFAACAVPATAQVIRVVPLEPDNPPLFKCGDRCKFRGDVPDAPIRLRIIRGNVEHLARLSNHPGYVAAGCVEFLSTVVRPRRSRRRSQLVDLQFYFKPTWLAANGRDGEFVFIIERDDRPDGPQIERSSMLRVPAGRLGEAYFRAGVNVTVLAPLNQRTFGTTKKKKSRPATAAMSREPAGGSVLAMAVDVPTSVPEPPSAAPMPVRADCADIVVEDDAIFFQRADAPPRRARTVTRTASKD
jgi:hypothetical protein